MYHFSQYTIAVFRCQMRAMTRRRCALRFLDGQPALCYTSFTLRKRLRKVNNPQDCLSAMSQVSITDIAAAAGVSPSTVSRALQDHPRISPARRQAIQALAQQMGYRPSQVARSLVTGHTRTLGVVITDVTDPFVAEVMKGAELASRESGYTLLFASSDRDPDREIEALRLLRDRQVDGMIVISGRAGPRYAELRGTGEGGIARAPYDSSD